MKNEPKPVLLSIKPEYVELIFSGAKTVELRRVVPRAVLPNSDLIIYSTSPQKSIVGKARIERRRYHSLAAQADDRSKNKTEDSQRSPGSV